MNKYYADYAATSPIHPDVVEEMTEVMHHIYGNPSSIHAYGREARKIIDEARTSSRNPFMLISMKLFLQAVGLKQIIWL